ncbi:thiol-disulfide oxidoreductase DCC family protein [Marinobacterium jannaschii]|uniref:thiol-disulfide oxidoreductase DCC family protein n=1 Tax=Marinobacterium jannaschii TaxID=64970 RepID=UPI000561B7F5|nr:DUF393 domain-containing protein [Marinobacterium jannaschii]
MSVPRAALKPVVFYDGSCPLCRREIAHYQRLDRRNRIQWVDISIDASLLKQHKICPDKALRLFHVLDRMQHLHIGVDAFVIVWRELPGYRWLARLVTISGMTPLLNAAYRRFAAWRYRHRSCQSVSCTRS